MQARPWRPGAHMIDSYSPHYRGEMAEWLKAHAWKACIPQGIQSSNLCLSATTFIISNLRNTDTATDTVLVDFAHEFTGEFDKARTDGRGPALLPCRGS